ncbi:MAG: DNA polymerase III subunit beta, partial [Oscillospiraceae bacterium]|nr:DNA polymerase III subunit beta [Oscillospiraceae bacterium]
MKLVCDKAQLTEIINTVQRAISYKTTNFPILECIKIDADGSGRVVFTGCNIGLRIEYSTDCTVTEGGSIALGSRMFGDIVRRMPDGNVSISVNLSNNVTTIKSGNSKFNIQG